MTVAVAIGVPALAAATATLTAAVVVAIDPARVPLRRGVRAVLAVVFLATLPAVAGSIALAPAWLTGLVTYGAFALIVTQVRSPGGGAIGRLPRIADGPVPTRVEALSARIGIPPVPVHRWGSQPGYAAVVGALAPRIIVSDGILVRLPPEQQDAILAHELGHVATGSMWWRPTATALAAAAGLLATRLGGSAWCVLAALPVFSVLVAVVNRRFELACDRVAVRAVGHAAAAQALDKIHALRDRGRRWVVAVLDATATHPSLAVRRAHIARTAPAEELEAVGTEPVAAPIVAGGVAAALASAGIAAGIRLGDHGGGLFVAVWSVPWLATWALVGSEAARQLRQLGRRPAVVLLPPVATLLAVVLLSLPSVWGLVPLAVVAVRPWAWAGARRGVEVRLEEAVRDHRFEDAVALAARAPAEVAASVSATCAVALAEAAVGATDRAVARLDAAAARHPDAALLPAVRARLLLETDPATALAASREIVQRWPEDAGGWVVLARAARALERTAELEAASAAAIAREPYDGRALATGVAAAMDRADLDGARAALARAEAASPGDTHLAVIRAELLARSHDADAPAALDRAAAAVAAQPLLRLDGAIGRLRAGTGGWW